MTVRPATATAASATRAALAAVGQVAAVAGDAPSERGPDDPVFVRWLEPQDPQDQTILDYWRRFTAGELSPNETVDLGTMLFHRG